MNGFPAFQAFPCTLVLFFCLLANPSPLLALEAAPETEQDRPRIGLVLSGGGAKGAAHVGVIQVLERLGIKVDVVVGTSMGAIVGGLYASGLSGEELERAIREIDWIEIFDDTPPRVDRSFRSKEDDANFLMRYRLGIKDGEPQLPRGLILGQKLTLALRKLSNHTTYTADFDNLAIPFRAVAADLETGEAVVLKSGSLALAMRASMSVPGLFPPVEYDGRVLVDGGVANNLPVEVARAFGADILLVVNVQTDPRPREQIKSVLGIVDQTINLLILRATREQLALLRSTDVLIEPELGGIDTADFPRMGEAIESGKVAAQAATDRLAALGRETGAQSRSAGGPTSATKQPPVITAVRIHNDTPLADEVLQAQLQVREGQPLDVPALEKDLSRIYGLDYFETVDYTLIPRERGTELDIIAKEKYTGLNNLRFGLNLQSDFDGDSLFDLSLEYNMTGLNRLGGEWRNEVVFGDRLRFATDFYQPLDYGFRWFIEPQAYYEGRDVNVYANGRRLAEYRVQQGGGGIEFGRRFGTCCDIRSGLVFGKGEADLNVGTLKPSSSHFDIGSLIGAAKYDTLDNLRFPRHGALGAVIYADSTKMLGADPESKQLQFTGLLARSWDRNTFLLRLRSGVTLKGAGQVQNLFSLGGFLNLSGFSEDEISGKDAALTTLVYYRRVGEIGASSLGIPLYLGGSFEYGGVYEDIDDFFSDDSLVAGAVFLGADTPFGPLYLGYGIAERGNRQAYLFLGEVF